MPRWLQVTLHLATAAAAAYISYATGTPLPSVIAGGVQTALGAISQAYNTNGTPQAEPFTPAPKAK